MKMTDRQIVDEMQSDSIRNEVRKIISFTGAGIEQQSAQRVSIFDLRRMEFEAADRIIAIVKGRMTPEEQRRIEERLKGSLSGEARERQWIEEHPHGEKA